MNTEVIKIEKGIPIPEGRWNKNSEINSIFEQMDEGDSFLVDDSPAVRNRYTSAAKALGYSVATRMQPKGKARIWVTAKPSKTEPTQKFGNFPNYRGTK